MNKPLFSVVRNQRLYSYRNSYTCCIHHSK